MAQNLRENFVAGIFRYLDMEYAEQPIALRHVAGRNGTLLGCDMRIELRERCAVAFAAKRPTISLSTTRRASNTCCASRGLGLVTKAPRRGCSVTSLFCASLLSASRTLGTRHAENLAQLFLGQLGAQRQTLLVDSLGDAVDDRSVDTERLCGFLARRAIAKAYTIFFRNGKTPEIRAAVAAILCYL